MREYVDVRLAGLDPASLEDAIRRSEEIHNRLWSIVRRQAGENSDSVTLGLGTAQRNIAAAMVVAGDNFTDPNVLIMVLVGAILMMALLLPGAGELGKRQAGAAAPTAPGAN